MELLLASPAQLHCTQCVCMCACMQNDLIDAAAVVQYNHFGVAITSCSPSASCWWHLNPDTL